jgi:hypothetical protein
LLSFPLRGWKVWERMLTGVLRGRPSRLQARFDLLTGLGRARSLSFWTCISYRVEMLFRVLGQVSRIECRSVPKQPSPDRSSPKWKSHFTTQRALVCLCATSGLQRQFGDARSRSNPRSLALWPSMIDTTMPRDCQAERPRKGYTVPTCT